MPELHEIKLSDDQARFLWQLLNSQSLVFNGVGTARSVAAIADQLEPAIKALEAKAPAEPPKE